MRKGCAVQLESAASPHRRRIQNPATVKEETYDAQQSIERVRCAGTISLGSPYTRPE